MKNKKTAYILAPIVVVIWAILLHNIYSALKNDNDDDLPVISKTTVREPFDDYEIPKDTTHLQLNYRDPFGIITQKDTAKPVRTITKNTIIALSKPVADWSFIKYSGYVRNPKTKELIAIMTINGQSEMMTEGETVDKVKLIKNMRDIVKIDFNGETRLINMNH